MNHDDTPVKGDILYGFVRLDPGYIRKLPDGSWESGCRVRRYDNRPSEPEHLVSDVIEWSGHIWVLP